MTLVIITAWGSMHFFAGDAVDYCGLALVGFAGRDYHDGGAKAAGVVGRTKDNSISQSPRAPRKNKLLET